MAAEVGYATTPEHRGYVIRVSVADTDEKAYEEGRHFFWQLGTTFGVAPRHWLQPPGYVTRAARRAGARWRAPASTTSRPAAPPSVTTRPTRRYQIVSGTPDTVIKKLQRIIDVADPAYMVFWGREGLMAHDVAVRGIDLMTRDVIPAIKEYQADREKGRHSLAAAGR